MKLLVTWLLVTTAGAALAAPAFAQLSADSGAGVASGRAPQPRARVPDFAPPAVPGAGDSSLATSLPVPRTDTGDPTTELFQAVNSGDYNGAQDAVSRGADMNAQNPLGETPLDLSIALNRNSITFMLLSARNESGGDQPVGTPLSLGPTATSSAHTYGRRHHRFTATPTPARVVATPLPQTPSAAAGPGTADPNAGFLGFNH